MMIQRNFLLLLLLLVVACGEKPALPEGTTSGQEKIGAPKTTFALRNLARLHGRRESEEGFTEAARLLDQILEGEPNDVRALIDRLSAATQIKSESASALMLLDRITKLKVPDSQKTRLSYLAGIANKRNEKYDAAWRAFEEVTKQHPDHPQARYQAGQAAEKAGNLEAAKRHFTYLLEHDELIRPASYRLSRVALRLGDEPGMTAALKVFESRPNDEKPLTEASVFLRPSPAPFRHNELNIASTPLLFSASHMPFDAKAVQSWELLNQKQLAYVDANGRFRVVGADGKGFTDDGKVKWSRFVTGDLDNDGTNDALLLSTVGVTVVLNFESGGQANSLLDVKGWQSIKIVSEMTLLDVDHDGDLDALFVSAHQADKNSLMLLRNLGDIEFSLETIHQYKATLQETRQVIAANDFDEGNDIDIVVPGTGGALTVLMNLRDDKWQPHQIEGPARSVCVTADFSGDGLPDIIAVGGQSGASLLINANVERSRGVAPFEKVRELKGATGIWQAAVPADIDNDGDIDCILGGNGVCVLRNRGRGTFDVEFLSAAKKMSVNSIALTDHDMDGVLEIVVCNRELGGLEFFEVKKETIGNSVTFLADGRKDNRDGIGAIVEVFAGTIHSTRMITNRGPLHFGVGKQALDGFSVRWPQGIRQAVVDDTLQINEKNEIRVKQKQGLVASCPFLFTHGENGWRFKSDIVGIAPLDEWLPAGQQPHLDPEEFIRLDQKELAIVDGQVKLAVTEELREITYLDRVELYYMDLAPTTLVKTDESTRQEAYGPLKFLTTNADQISQPRSVFMNKKDVTAVVLTKDRHYLHAYSTGPSQLQGWGPRQEVEIVLATDARALTLSGRLAWYDSTTSYALAQSGRTWEEPRVEVLNALDQWETLIPTLGFPAGMDRSLVVPFPNGELSAGTKIRLVSNQRFLWDQIGFIGDHEWHEINTKSHTPVKDQRLKQARLTKAVLRDRGFSITTGDVEEHEQNYLWQAEPRDEFPKATGWATAYGDVENLLNDHDDRFCILVAADAVDLNFSVVPIAKGLRRTWFLRVTGWAKESSYHNRTGRDIAPLPHQAMKSYPPLQDLGNRAANDQRSRGIR
ncbi:MAG: tetratricopeptide (TPR) repeat protein [Planctomycetota bacterium]|jgi:tetratricopeptide (TPR) repeat protein